MQTRDNNAKSIIDGEIEALFNAPTDIQFKPLDISEEQSLQLAYCQSREQAISPLQKWGYEHILSR